MPQSNLVSLLTIFKTLLHTYVPECVPRLSYLCHNVLSRECSCS